MKEKCKQYEGLMTFGDEERLLAHIETCEDCRAEHERMARVSELIQEVAPSIKEKRRNNARLKMACASFALVLFVSTLGVVNFNTDIHDTIMYGQTMTLEDYGLPVDSYGLIMVN
ncbi:zf-HC2 domain-containing protein [bacterium]|nr:zf-HC2 domain-containing protein [bacterium]